MNIFYHTLESNDSSQPPAWHYGIRCKLCGHLIARTPNRNEHRPASAPRDLVPVRCTLCHHEQLYDAAWAAPLIDRA